MATRTITSIPIWGPTASGMWAPTGQMTTPLTSPAGQQPNNFNSIVENAIPGFGGMTTGASGIVNQLMQGMPSAAPTQRANAYFGAQSGMPGSDFVRNRGFDLYGQEAEAHKQRGFDNFLKMIGTYSGNVMPTAGQTLQAQESALDRSSRNAQAAAQLALERQRMDMDKPIMTGTGSGQRHVGYGSTVPVSWTNWLDPRTGRRYSKSS